MEHVTTTSQQTYFYRFFNYTQDGWYGDDAGNTAEENSSISPNLTALVVICKGMRAVNKLSSNKILQFLTGGGQLMRVILYNGHKRSVVAVVVLVVVLIIQNGSV